MLSLEELGEGYIGTLCTIFITSEFKIISKNILRDDIRLRKTKKILTSVFPQHKISIKPMQFQ